MTKSPKASLIITMLIFLGRTHVEDVKGEVYFFEMVYQLAFHNYVKDLGKNGYNRYKPTYSCPFYWDLPS